tara:strand:- start:255 stop:401 length:147 start_codon:yes stop_codon:yes gene_type:complete
MNPVVKCLDFSSKQGLIWRTIEKLPVGVESMTESGDPKIVVSIGECFE